MKYAGMPLGMWALFAESFRKQLSSVYGYDPETAKAIVATVLPKFRQVAPMLPQMIRIFG